MQYPHPGPAAAGALGVPLYAPTPLLQPAHPTPFYIEDILGRGPAAPTPTPTLPSPNSSFTSLVSSYRTPVYEPTPIHPAFSHHSAAALAAAYGPGGFGGPLYPFPRSVNDYTHALLRHDPLGKAAGVMAGPSPGGGEKGATRQVAAPRRRRGRRGGNRKLWQKRLKSGCRARAGDGRRGPRRRAAQSARTMTQIGFPAPCRRRGARARAGPRALPLGPAAGGVRGSRVARVGSLSWRDWEGRAKAPRAAPAGQG